MVTLYTSNKFSKMKLHCLSNFGDMTISSMVLRLSICSSNLKSNQACMYATHTNCLQLCNKFVCCLLLSNKSVCYLPISNKSVCCLQKPLCCLQLWNKSVCCRFGHFQNCLLDKGTFNSRTIWCTWTPFVQILKLIQMSSLKNSIDGDLIAQ